MSNPEGNRGEPRGRASPMKVFTSVEELKTAVGTHLGFSGWHLITQQQIDTFAEATGDHQWIHVDPEAAAKGPFGRTIAHGYLTLSLVPRLVNEVYDIGGVTMLVNYGANKLRFPLPVPVDSSIRAGVEIHSLEQGGGGHQLTARVSVELEGGQKPACVADIVTFLVP